jgi:hypothetical protein
MCIRQEYIKTVFVGGRGNFDPRAVLSVFEHKEP